MSGNPLISIIVPIYNVEEYLSRCLDSLVCQTYTNLEIILVNDGSTDRSGQIADTYANTDQRVRVIHKNNGGVSSARNSGLAKSTGDYVMFVDADDRIHTRTCEICIDNVKNNEDFIYFSVSRLNKHEQGSTIEGGLDGSIEYLTSNKEIIKDYLNGGNLRAVARMYKTSVMNGLAFDTKMRIHEDALFAFNFLKKSQSAIKIKLPLYFYISRADSAMKSFTISDIKDVKRHYNEVVGYISTTYPELYSDTLERSMEILFNLLTIAKQVKSEPDLARARYDIRQHQTKLGSKYKMTISHKLKFTLSYFPLPVFNSVLLIFRKLKKVA